MANKSFVPFIFCHGLFKLEKTTTHKIVILNNVKKYVLNDIIIVMTIEIRVGLGLHISLVI